MGSADDTSVRGRYLILLAAYAAAFDNFLLPPMLVSMARDFGTSMAAVTGAASAYFLTYGLMQLVWGVASERLGRVTVIRLGLGGGAVACVLAAMAPGLTLVTAARMLGGAMLASVVPASVTWVGDVVPPARRTDMIADINAAYAAGTAAGTLIGGMAAELIGWRGALLFSTALAGGTALLLARVPRPAPRPPGAPSLLSSAGVVLRDGWAWVVVLLALVEGAVLFGTVTFLSPALVSRGVSSGVAGLVVAGYGVAIILWTRVLKLMAGHWSATALLGLGGTMLLAAQAAAGWLPGMGGILAASLLASGTMAFMHSTLQVWATEVVPGARALAVALFATALFVGSAISTRSLASLAGGSFQPVFALLAAITLPLTLGAVAARLRYMRRASGAPP